MIKVYKIINKNGVVEHVGHTHDIQMRWVKHTKRKPSAGQGKFYQRTDVTYEVISEWDTKEKARESEIYWQVYYQLQDNGGYARRKHSDETIEYIRNSPKGNRELERELGISNSNISLIRNNKIYKTHNDPA